MLVHLKCDISYLLSNCEIFQYCVSNQEKKQNSYFKNKAEKIKSDKEEKYKFWENGKFYTNNKRNSTLE